MPEIEMIVEKKDMYAATVGERITIDVQTLIVLLEGEIIIEHQKCGCCQPKSTVLNKLGATKILDVGTTYRLKNNSMEKVSCLVIYPKL